MRVIPFSAGAHLGLEGPFSILEFDGDLDDVLYLE
ncbi:Scr1 family TA system antitoxin-like transcriptional regulator, partial [Actinomadura latina]